MTVKVEDKRLFAPDGTPLEPISPSESSPPLREEPAPSATHRPAPLPPPRFEDLVVMIGAQAGLCLGGPTSELSPSAPPKDLEAARHFIDLLDVLAGKTRGNLTPEEDAFLREVLAGLRLQFVRAAERS